LPPRRQRKQQEVGGTPLELPQATTARLIDEETYDQTLETLVTALEARRRLPRGRYARVTEYALDIGRHLGLQPGTPAWHDLKRAALLNDVGTIGVSDFILHKPGPLTPEEWEEMKRHPAIGYEMFRHVKSLSDAAAIIHAHHERFDGKGYPSGLAGDEIPLGARILAVADTFDAMTSDRPYRRALPWEVAHDEIVKQSGAQFDPRVVNGFLECYEGWFREPHPLRTEPSFGDRRREIAWLAANRGDLEARYAGKWIAVDGDDVVAVDDDLATAMRKAKAKGVGDPLVVAARFKECQEAVQVAQWL
jgi:HD-GYP domain-containing protein (c-di-GMP phosphodiesterase class II)